MAKKDEIFKLIRSIWKKPNTGFIWIDAKFKPKLHLMTGGQLDVVIECLDSKYYIKECPVHGRIHEGQPKKERPR